MTQAHVLGLIAALCLAPLSPAAAQSTGSVSATLRLQPELHDQNDEGVLADANRLLLAGSDRLTSELELRMEYGALSGIATWRHSEIEMSGRSDELVLNELFASHQLADWYLTVGKRIMSWDVGYAFRPLDVVQQEDRRRLIGTTLEGVPLLAAETFGASSAWSVVIANPGEGRNRLGREEPAIAVRGYWRIGPADVYAVARDGTNLKWRAGAAIAYVARESLEWHASLLRAQHLAQIVPETDARGSPTRYGSARADAGWQALAGFSWTNAHRVSILMEAWHDDSAWDDEHWRTWRRSAAAIASLPVPQSSQAGLLASAAEAQRTPSLRRDNLSARLSHTGEKFSPSADVLYMPEDGGLIATTRLSWTGDRISGEVGWRRVLGAADSIARQLPFKQILYASIEVSF